MKILTITTLYPNLKQFRHGVFIETRLRHLLQTGEIQAIVIAPVTWVATVQTHTVKASHNLVNT